jgi:hypothetical protein
MIIYGLKGLSEGILLFNLKLPRYRKLMHTVKYEAEDDEIT